VLGRLVEEERRVLAFPYQAALHVGERGHDGVDAAAVHLLPQLVEAQHAAILSGRCDRISAAQASKEGV
jgi:hypothetical protein